MSHQHQRCSERTCHCALSALGRSRQKTSFIPCSTTTPSTMASAPSSPVSRACGLFLSAPHPNSPTGAAIMPPVSTFEASVLRLFNFASMGTTCSMASRSVAIAKSCNSGQRNQPVQILDANMCRACPDCLLVLQHVDRKSLHRHIRLRLGRVGQGSLASVRCNSRPSLTKTKNAIGLLKRRTLLRGSLSEFNVAPSLQR